MNSNNILKERIKEKIENNFPKSVEFLQSLIQIDSTYGKEENVQLFIEKKMKILGLEVEKYYSRKDDNSINLVARIKGSENRNFKSLILNAHSDIAPIEHPELWSKYPLSGEIQNGFIYGRGSQDDKAGIAIIMLIIDVLKSLNITLKGDLIIQSVIDDEVSGDGSKALIDNGIFADGVIIIDGTWSQQIIYAHLGQVSLNVKIKGDPVAACVEYRGTNPIYIGIKFIENLRKYIDDLNESDINGFEGIKRPYYFNVGSFHSGIWHGAVPSEANVSIQIGFSNKYSPEQIIQEVINISKAISTRIEIQQGLLQIPATIRKENQLVKNLKRIIEFNSGKSVIIKAITGYCDIRHFPTSNICLYGPGEGFNAHGIDERYRLDQMVTVTQNLIDFILEWCNDTK